MQPPAAWRLSKTDKAWVLYPVPSLAPPPRTGLVSFKRPQRRKYATNDNTLDARADATEMDRPSIAGQPQMSDQK